MDIAELIAEMRRKDGDECYVKFDTEDEAITRLKLATALKFGDEVKFYGNENKETRGVFWGWDGTHALILFCNSGGKIGRAKMVPTEIIFND